VLRQLPEGLAADGFGQPLRRKAVIMKETGEAAAGRFLVALGASQCGLVAGLRPKIAATKAVRALS